MELGTSKDALNPFFGIAKILKLSAFFIVGCVLLCCVVAAVFFVWPDVDPVDDSDLVLLTREGTDEALTGRFIAAMDKLEGWDDFQAWRQFQGRWEEIRDTPQGGTVPPELSACVEPNQQVLAEVEALMPELASSWSLPPDDIIGISSEENTRWVENFQKLLFFIDSAMQYHRIREEPAETLRLAALLLRFSRVTADASNSLLDHLLAQTGWQLGLGHANPLFGTGYYNREQTLEFIRLLAESRLTKKSFRNAMIGEYQLFKRTILHCAENGKFPGGPNGEPIDKDVPYFQPHRTIAIAESSMRRVVQSLDEPGYVREAGLSNEYYMSREPRGELTTFFHYCGPNYFGHMLGNGSARIWAEFHSSWYDLAARTEVSRILLAIDLHARAHGEYPKSLNSLVPDLLPEVPRDAYDPESPLRYMKKPNGGVDLWSVGSGKITEINETALRKGHKIEHPHLEVYYMDRDDDLESGDSIIVFRIPEVSTLDKKDP